MVMESAGSPKRRAVMGKQVNMDLCSKAQFSYGDILCKAGVNKGRPLPMKIRKEMGDKPEIFVKMDVAEPWLCKAVTGKTNLRHTSIRRTSLLETLLQQHIIPALGVCPDEVEAVEEDKDTDDDPMDEVAAPVVTGLAGRVYSGNKKTVHRQMPVRYRCRNPGKGRILKCEMPMKAPEAFPDCAERRIVTVFMLDKRVVWLHMDDVDWAIQYMYAQNELKGVPLITKDSVGPATP